MNIICKGCEYFGTKTTPVPAQFLLFGCKLKKKTFGLEIDLEKKCPKKCNERVKI